MFDLMLLFVVGFIGIIIVIFGLITMIGSRISEPKEATQYKINQLEREIENLKGKKC